MDGPSWHRRFFWGCCRLYRWYDSFSWRALSLTIIFLFQKYPYQLPPTMWSRRLCPTGLKVMRVLWILIALLKGVSLMGVGGLCNECWVTYGTHWLALFLIRSVVLYTALLRPTNSSSSLVFSFYFIFIS